MRGDFRASFAVGKVISSFGYGSSQGTSFSPGIELRR